MPATRVAPISKSPNPSPPAAPAPRATAGSLPSERRPHNLLKCSSAPSSSITAKSSAPFCGPKTALAPRSPKSGLSTSLATINSIPATLANAGVKSRVPSCFSAAPPESSLASLIAPSAASIPAPASFVPLPPRPTTILVAPRLIASAINSPTPKVVVILGSRSARAIKCNPHA